MRSPPEDWVKSKYLSPCSKSITSMEAVLLGFTTRLAVMLMVVTLVLGFVAKNMPCISPASELYVKLTSEDVIAMSFPAKRAFRGSSTLEPYTTSTLVLVKYSWSGLVMVMALVPMTIGSSPSAAAGCIRYTFTVPRPLPTNTPSSVMDAKPSSLTAQ